MNTQKMHLAGLVLAMGLSGTAHAALQGRDLNGSVGSFEAYYDTVLNITWLADANQAKTSGYDADGKMAWTDANTWATNLGFVDNINNIVYDNWRLPTVEPINGRTFNYGFSTIGSTDIGYNITSPQSEMAHLFYVTLGNPGYYTPTGASSNCYVSGANTCLDNVGPFANLQAYFYSFATEYTPITGTAWIFTTDYGLQNASYKSNGSYALAVSPGDVAITGCPWPCLKGIRGC